MAFPYNLFEEEELKYAPGNAFSGVPNLSLLSEEGRRQEMIKQMSDNYNRDLYTDYAGRPLDTDAFGRSAADLAAIKNEALFNLKPYDPSKHTFQNKISPLESTSKPGTVFYKGVETPINELPAGARFLQSVRETFPSAYNLFEKGGDAIVPDFISQSEIAKERGQKFLEKPVSATLETAADVAAAGYLPVKGLITVGKKALPAMYKLATSPKGVAVIGYGTTKYFANQEEADKFLSENYDKMVDYAKSVMPEGDKDVTQVAKDATKTGVAEATTEQKQQGLLSNQEISDNINTQPSRWKQMQTKGYWTDPVEGGAGKWDNRLFRLSEMMMWMGTNPKDRGDNPTKRWTTTAKNAQDAYKDLKTLAGKQLTAQQKRWADAVPTLGNLETQYMQEPSGLFGGKKPGVKEKAQAAAKANLHRQIAMQLIAKNIEPTRERVQPLLAKYLEELAKRQTAAK